MAIWRRPKVKEETGLSDSGLYRQMKAGTFPKPVRIDKRAVGWSSEAVQAWINARIAESQSNAA